MFAALVRSRSELNWLSNDPIGIAGGLNQFVAFGNNPVMFTDAFGLCPEDSTAKKVVGAGIQGYLDHQAGVLAYFTSQFESSNQLANLLHLPSALPAPLMSWMTQKLHQGMNAQSQWFFGKSAQDEGLSYSLGKVSGTALLIALTTGSGSTQKHHIWPKYLGGDPKGARVALSPHYHQRITNAFRHLHKYGSARPSTRRALEIMRQVYRKFPLPNKPPI